MTCAVLRGGAGGRHQPRIRPFLPPLSLVPALLRAGVPRGERQGAGFSVHSGLERLILEEFADAYPGRFIPMMLIP